MSWFEADAFARAHGTRLPTEAEWEKAATAYAAPGTGLHAQPSTRRRRPRGRLRNALPGAALPRESVGVDADGFDGYPGFRAHPYREYSEVFFGDDYRVLRGGSWATDPRIAGPRFRNWDLPQRRQIFAGLRLARDAR